MDKRNRPALAYLLAGITTAGRALLAVPEGTAVAELTLAAVALAAYLLLGRRGLPMTLCGAAQLILECFLCSTTAAPPLLRAVDLWLLLVCALLMLRAAGQPWQLMPGVAALPLAVYTLAAFLPIPAGVSTAAFVLFSVLLLWYTVLMIRAYNAARVKKT